ncbi:hypothetical protein AB0F32_24505 [Streptomyces albidoflavus]|uniref:hypothetical protein n=1 Tax=Streptomyces albidoflavus TaxID=1886 RepID=UPI0033FE9547|nr:hypothetical protein OH723_24295 [Streptomyces albidoflavus]
MALSTTQRVAALRTLMAEADNEYIAAPLWEFHPLFRLAVLSERRRRHLLNNDPEPIGDNEYT